MDNNPYKPPEANLTLEDTVEANDSMFYVVSPKKFLLLFIGTLGIYQLYWFYENWSKYKAHKKLSLWPIPRALFSIFFAHSLFRIINEKLVLKNNEKGWNHSFSATLFVLFTLVSNADKLFEEAFGELISYTIVIIMIPLTAWILYEVQIRINQVCGSIDGEENSKITGANIFWLALGGILWLLLLFGFLLIINPDLLSLVE
jgi:hypothetical protein